MLSLLDLQPLHLERGQVPEHELAVPGHGGDRAPGGLVPGVVPGVGRVIQFHPSGEGGGGGGNGGSGGGGGGGGSGGGGGGGEGGDGRRTRTSGYLSSETWFWCVVLSLVSISLEPSLSLFWNIFMALLAPDRNGN